jgi:hypothetical protein
VRGQLYLQTGAFFHPMSNNHEVRVLELDTTCPDCSETFQATASMRQIRTRQLVRRCPTCREIHSGPVKMRPAAPKPAARKSKRKATTGRKQGKARGRRSAAPKPLTSAAAAAMPAPHPKEPTRDYRLELAILD